MRRYITGREARRQREKKRKEGVYCRVYREDREDRSKRGQRVYG